MKSLLTVAIESYVFEQHLIAFWSIICQPNYPMITENEGKLGRNTTEASSSV